MSERTAPRLARAIDRWIFAAEPARRMHGAFVVVALTIAARLALPPYRGLAGQPDALFDPPPLLAWLPGMPPSAAIVALQVVGVVAAFGALVRRGRARRVALVTAWLCLLVLAGLRASRGKIQHNDLLLLFAAVPLLAAPTDTSWRDRRVDVGFGWPLRTGMATVALVYWFSGVAKLLSSGPAWMLSSNMQHILHDAARGPKTHAADLARWIGDHGALARAIAVATIVFEIGFPVALVWTRARLPVVLGALALHGSVFLLLGLDYSPWVASVVAFFVPWERVYTTVIARSGQFSAPERA